MAYPAPPQARPRPGGPLRTAQPVGAVDPRVAALLAKMGINGFAPHELVANPAAPLQRPQGPGGRRAIPVGAPHLRVAHQGAPPVDLSAIGGGLTAIPGPALEGGPDQGPRTAQGPVAPPGMPPATPQPAGGPTFGQGMNEMNPYADQEQRMGQMLNQGQPQHVGQPQRVGQLGRQNAIARQLVQRLMLHRHIQRLAQPAGPGY